MTPPPSNGDPPPSPTPTSRAEQERDFYRKILELGQAKEIKPFLADALALIVQITGARRGYVELVSDRVRILWNNGNVRKHSKLARRRGAKGAISG